MNLQKLRENCERGYEIDLVHQNSVNENVTVLVDRNNGCRTEVKVFRYHIDDNNMWQPNVLYDGDDFVCGMNEFNKCLENTPIDPNTGLEFTCPFCGCMAIECCQDGYHVSRVTRIDEDGDHEYGSIISDGDTTRWQCEGCGYTLQNDYGDITDNVEVAEWIKENCK